MEIRSFGGGARVAFHSRSNKFNHVSSDYLAVEHVRLTFKGLPGYAGRAGQDSDRQNRVRGKHLGKTGGWRGPLGLV
jgi:hypothetical protein